MRKVDEVLQEVLALLPPQTGDAVKKIEWVLVKRYQVISLKDELIKKINPFGQAGANIDPYQNLGTVPADGTWVHENQREAVDKKRSMIAVQKTLVYSDQLLEDAILEVKKLKLPVEVMAILNSENPFTFGA